MSTKKKTTKKTIVENTQNSTPIKEVIAPKEEEKLTKIVDNVELKYLTEVDLHKWLRFTAEAQLQTALLEKNKLLLQIELAKHPEILKLQKLVEDGVARTRTASYNYNLFITEISKKYEVDIKSITIDDQTGRITLLNPKE